jgi:quercetin dioxygenase-like cupin family protein
MPKELIGSQKPVARTPSMPEHLTRKVRRVVTGHDADGCSIIVLDDHPAATPVGANEDKRSVVEIWSTIGKSEVGPGQDCAPKEVSGSALGPNATEIRIVEMGPGCRREMHRTDTVDYGLVLQGELFLVLERAETLLQAGDVVVQRGTNHLWHNRSAAPTTIAFINMSGQTTDRDRCPDL